MLKKLTSITSGPSTKGGTSSPAPGSSKSKTVTTTVTTGTTATTTTTSTPSTSTVSSGATQAVDTSASTAPKSTAVTDSVNAATTGVMGDIKTIIRRNRPGTKENEFSKWPDESFEEMDSTLAVQQWIQQTINKDPSNVMGILTPPETQDEEVWKYEHLRQFCMELNGLAVKLQAECFPDTCTQMTATEQWIFLCAAHKSPKECPAIDYTRHTLDGAACLLNSNKYFPSRVSIRESSLGKLGSVCRRVYRIFSHAFFHHKVLFDDFEGRSHLCKRFTCFVIKYNLMSRDNLIVPNMEDGSLEGVNETPPSGSSPAKPATVVATESDA